MKNNLYDITLLEISNIKNLHSLSTNRNNILDIWYLDLDYYPKHYLFENLLSIFHPNRNVGKKYNLNLYSKFLENLKLNAANNYDYKDFWDYSHYIHMFNKEGNLIGDIIEVNYDEIIYNNNNYDYNPMLNEIYEAISNNTQYSNPYFYLYFSDDEKLYDRLDMYKHPTIIS